MTAARPPRALTREEVRRVDQVAIHDLGLSGLILMENAGLGLTESVLRELNRRSVPADRLVGIVCGKGNNGGDGYVLARHLTLRGRCARVVVTSDPDPESDAGHNLSVLRRDGWQIAAAPDGAALREVLASWTDVDLLVDGLLGTGISSALREPALGWVQALDADPRPKLAIDLPSGLDCDTGEPLGAVVRAVRTVTFVAEKIGFAKAHEFTGDVDVVPIGCPASAWGFVGS